MAAKKISVSLEEDLVAWLGDRAEQGGASVSGVIGEAVAALRQHEARLEVLDLLGGPASTHEVEEEVRRFVAAVEQAEPKGDCTGVARYATRLPARKHEQARGQSASKKRKRGPVAGHSGRRRVRKRSSR